MAAREGRDVIVRHAAGFALGLAGFTWITSAVLFTLVEDVGEGERVHSFFDALWWSLTTMTTVGYGDVYPITAAGRILGGFTMVVGISAFAIVTAKVAEFLVRFDAKATSDAASAEREEIKEALRRIEASMADRA
jgi:voltage-gated potassium channel